ncbi:MAG: CoA protein activase [Firmicutes bacterium]|nr:CoA protein activase [Bacillota bacterium]
MKVTFPHMGNLYIPVRAILQELGLEVVVPPLPSKNSLNFGVKHSPEFACFPLKVNLGDFIEAHHRGADTVIMAGGSAPCRFGYYAEVQREILRDLGYELEMVVLEPPRGHLGELLEKIRRLTGKRSLRQVWAALQLGWEKFLAVDEVERLSHRVRPREGRRGSTTAAYRQALALIDQAGDIQETRSALARGEEILNNIPRKSGVSPVRIGLVGEIFMLLEPFANLHLEEALGELGAEVERSLYLSDWIKTHLFLDALRWKKKKESRVAEAAAPYLRHFVGGDGLDSVGNTVLYAQQGFDGVIQLMPFTCMPEIVAQSILPRVSQEKNIPVLTLILDEQSGEAGIRTRLEAFVDLLERRRTALAQEE